MRNAIAQVGIPDNLGLAYDVWAPVETNGDNAGKVANDRKVQWLNCLAEQPIHSDYRAAYELWKSSLQDGRTIAFEVTTTSRLLIGHGNAAPSEVGLTLHRTWGVPVIPGSALKGLLNHYIDANYGGDEDNRRAYKGVGYDGNRIVRGPGTIHKIVFGSPDAEDGTMASMGHFIFHDAMYIPQSLENDKVLAIDVITPHQFEYYKNSGSAWPNDYDNPVPVQFLNVKPGARFLVAISGETGWAQFVVARLKEALAEWGIGGKTSSGYGRVERQWRQVVDPSRARIYTSQLISDFKEWKKNNNFQQRDFFKEIVSQWLPRFSNATTEEKKALNEIINTDYPDKKIKREEIRDLKLQVLNSLLN